MPETTTVLVTGGTGFVGMRVILQLLNKGYAVKTTMRDLKNAEKLKNTLLQNAVQNLQHLSFVQTELTSDDNWEDAMQGCKYVMSIASPVFFEKPKNAEDAVRPALEGILRILKFARKTGVKRLVMTSNFGAVGFSQTDKTRKTTEDDWTDTTLKGLSLYEKSKTLAEKAAWDFIKTEGGGLEFVTINPVAILGPSLDAHISGSFHLLQNLLTGSMKAVPNIPLNVVDVRDVADLHIRAMETPEAAGKRFIATADGQISLQQIAALLKEKRPEISLKVSAKKVPDIALKIGSLFNHQAREGLVLLKMNRNVSNEQAKNILGWKPVATQKQTILEAVDSLAKFGLL